MDSKQKYFELENIVSILPDHVYWKDKNGVYLGCNEAQARSNNLKSRFDIVGKVDADLMSKKQAEFIKKIDSQVMSTGEEITIEEELTVASGETKIFLSKKSPIKNDMGEVIGLIGLSRDITENIKALRKAKQVAEQVNIGKSIFLTILNQRSRNMLCSIVGASEIIRSVSAENETKHQAEMILEASYDWLNKMDFILKHLSSDAVIHDENSAEFELCSLLKTSIKKASEVAYATEVDVMVEYFEPPITLIGRGASLLKVLKTVLAKSIGRSGCSEVLIHVFYKNRLESKLDLNINLIDNGLRMPETKINGIFDFLTVPENLNDIANIDLELSVAKDKLEKMGGSLSVVSNTFGNEIIFSLPVEYKLTSEKELEAKEAIKAVAILADSTKKLKILKGIFSQIDTYQLRSIHHLNELFEREIDSLIIYGRYDESDIFKLCTQLRNRSVSIHKVGKEDSLVQSFANLFSVDTPIDMKKFRLEVVHNHLKLIKNFNEKEKKEDPKYNLLVLVVEDDYLNSYVIVTLLKNLGCTVLSATNAEDAITIAKKNKFNLALLDISLPDMNGQELAGKLIELDPSAKIAAVTALGTDAEKEKCLDVGMFDVLEKPISKEDIINLLNDYLTLDY